MRLRPGLCRCFLWGGFFGLGGARLARPGPWAVGCLDPWRGMLFSGAFLRRLFPIPTREIAAFWQPCLVGPICLALAELRPSLRVAGILAAGYGWDERPDLGAGVCRVAIADRGGGRILADALAPTSMACRDLRWCSGRGEYGDSTISRCTGSGGRDLRF